MNEPEFKFGDRVYIREGAGDSYRGEGEFATGLRTNLNTVTVRTDDDEEFNIYPWKLDLVNHKLGHQFKLPFA